MAAARTAASGDKQAIAIDCYDQAVLEARFPGPGQPVLAADAVAKVIAECRLEQAQVCLHEKQYPRVVGCVDEALATGVTGQLSPAQVADGMVVRAMAHWCLGHYEAALADYAEARDMAPDAKWTVAFGDALLGRGAHVAQGLQCSRAKDWQGALAHFGAAILVREDEVLLGWRANVHERLGHELLARSDRESAASLTALQKPPAVPTPAGQGPTSAEADHGYFYVELSGQESVPEELRDQLQWLREDDRFRRRLAEFGRRNGWVDLAGLEDGCRLLFASKHQDAVAWFSGQIDQQPRRAVLYHCRSIALSDANRRDEALADASQLVALAPDHPAGLQWRAYLFELQQHDELARADLSRAIELAPRSVAAYIHRGLLADRQGDQVAAAADYRRAIEIGTDEPWVWIAAARIMVGSELQELFDPEHGLGLAQQAVAESPDDPWFLDILACAQAANGDFAKAVETEALALQKCRDAELRQTIEKNAAAFAAKQTWRDRIRGERQGGGQ